MNKRIVKQIFPGAVKRVEKGLCPLCSKKIDPDKEFKDELSKVEFGISGMCQSCQDQVFSNHD